MECGNAPKREAVKTNAILMVPLTGEQHDERSPQPRLLRHRSRARRTASGLGAMTNWRRRKCGRGNRRHCAAAPRSRTPPDQISPQVDYRETNEDGRIVTRSMAQRFNPSPKPLTFEADNEPIGGRTMAGVVRMRVRLRAAPHAHDFPSHRRAPELVPVAGAPGRLQQGAGSEDCLADT
jgi:hypothetical protein